MIANINNDNWVTNLDYYCCNNVKSLPTKVILVSIAARLLERDDQRIRVYTRGYTSLSPCGMLSSVSANETKVY